MTDPDLVHRAEQACLGALLARHGGGGPGDLVVPGELSAVDFTDPVHQAIFAALAGQAGSTRPAGPGGWLGRLRDLLERLLSRQARDAAAYMAELPSLCPDPANAAAYASMVAEASRHRADQARAQLAEQAAKEDPTLAGAGAWLDRTRTTTQPASRRAAQAQPIATPGTGPLAQAAASETSAPGEQDTATDLAPDVTRLARALRTSAQRATRADPDQQDQAERPAVRRAPEDSVTTDGGQTVATAPEDLERRVLASLMRHPEQGQAVARWLPAQAFAAAQHRDLYDLIRQRLASGRPVDPLIIAWDASRLPDTSSTGDGGTADLAQTALRVGALATAPGTAEVVGRALWAERILTTTVGKEWPADPERVIDLLSAPAPEGQAEQPTPALDDHQAVRPHGEPEAGPEVDDAPVKRPSSAQLLAPLLPRQEQPVSPVQRPPAPAPSGPALRM